LKVEGENDKDELPTSNVQCYGPWKYLNEKLSYTKKLKEIFSVVRFKYKDTWKNFIFINTDRSQIKAYGTESSSFN